MAYIEIHTTKQLESLATTLLTLITVFLGFVILKDVISKWKKRQEDIRKQIELEVNESIKKKKKKKIIIRELKYVNQEFKNIITY